MNIDRKERKNENRDLETLTVRRQVEEKEEKGYYKERLGLRVKGERRKCGI